MSEREPHEPVEVHLTCKDLKQSVLFYGHALGFHLEQAWPSANEPTWARFRMGSQKIVLRAVTDAARHTAAGDGGSRPSSERAARHASNAGARTALYVRVPDVDLHHTALRRRGCGEIHAPRTQIYGVRDFAVQDPDGYAVVFYSRIELARCADCRTPLSCAEHDAIQCAACSQASRADLEGTSVGTTLTGHFSVIQKPPRLPLEPQRLEHETQQPPSTRGV